MRAEIQIPKVTDKITFMLNSAIRDAVEYLEGNFPGDAIIALHGVINKWNDGNQEFVWKGKTVIHFHPLEMHSDGVNILFIYDKLYLEDNNETSTEFNAPAAGE